MTVQCGTDIAIDCFICKVHPDLKESVLVFSSIFAASVLVIKSKLKIKIA